MTAAKLAERTGLEESRGRGIVGVSDDAAEQNCCPLASVIRETSEGFDIRSCGCKVCKPVCSPLVASIYEVVQGGEIRSFGGKIREAVSSLLVAGIYEVLQLLKTAEVLSVSTPNT